MKLMEYQGSDGDEYETDDDKKFNLKVQTMEQPTEVKEKVYMDDSHLDIDMFNPESKRAAKPASQKKRRNVRDYRKSPFYAEELQSRHGYCDYTDKIQK